jgi:hypothetical protein
MQLNRQATLVQAAARVAARLTAPVLLGAAFAGNAAGAEPAAPAREPSREQLQQQLQQLQDRVRSLEATAQGSGPASATSTDIDKVLKDAERRSSVAPVLGAGGGFTAGYDKGFFIKSDDGNFLLKPAIQVQFRNVSNFEEGGKHKADDDSFQNGFELRRARFRFDGNAFSPKFTYSFVWDTNRANGNVTLLDAWGQYAFAKEWAIKGGQFKESVFHERDVSGYQQLTVDRSLNDAVLGGNLTDRVQGVSLVYGGTKDNPVRAELAYHDGANSRNTDFRDGATNWGAGVRGEYKLFGEWADYKDFTAKGGKQNLLVIGAGADYTDRDGAGVLLSTADVQYEAADKLIVYGAVHGNFTDPHENASGNGIHRFDWGALAQAGYLVTKQVEVFGRYDVVKLDGDAVTGEDTFHEITGGVNYYFGKDGQFLHRAKFSLDVTYLPNGAPSDQTQAGILAADEDEFVVRAQFQLLL